MRRTVDARGQQGVALDGPCIIRSSTVDPWEANVTQTSNQMIVDCLSKTINAKVIGEQAIIKVTSEQINVGLQHCNHVSILRRPNGTKENPTFCAVIKEDTLFPLNSEVKVVGTAELKVVGR